MLLVTNATVCGGRDVASTNPTLQEVTARVSGPKCACSRPQCCRALVVSSFREVLAIAFVASEMSRLKHASKEPCGSDADVLPQLLPRVAFA